MKLLIFFLIALFVILVLSGLYLLLPHESIKIIEISAQQIKGVVIP